MRQWHYLSARELSEQLAKKQVTPLDLVAHYLKRIEANNQTLGAFLTVTSDQAISAAQSSQIKQSLFGGVPHADKDLVQRTNIPVTFGSRAGGYLATETDPIAHMCDRIGLISLGKTNTSEFGLYGYTENELSDGSRHPLNPDWGAGGSSGGAATAVAAGLLPFAVGSDGGGSIRIPAATTGLVGLKPTLGALSCDLPERSVTGVVNGPLARDAQDAWLLFQALRDPSTRRLTTLRTPTSLRIAYATDSPWDDEYPFTGEVDLLDATQAGLSMLASLGHQIIGDISLKDPDYGKQFRTAWWRSAAAIPDDLDLSDVSSTTRYFIESGRHLTAEQIASNILYLDEYRHRMQLRLSDWDVLLTPALGMVPKPPGWFSKDPEENFTQQVAYSPFTSWVNLAHLPAITVPVTRVTYRGVPGVPVSVQLVANRGQEELLLSLALQLEKARGFSPKDYFDLTMSRWSA